MKSCVVLFVGLLLSVSVSAEPLLEGRVRLESGAPAAGVQVRLFDLTNLHQSVSTTTNETGHFTLSLPASAPGTALPQGFALGQNYPNPFNPSTIIPYQIPTAAHVRLEVFNVLGQRVATLVDGEQAAGAHTATWTATDETGRAVGAGVYIYRLVSGGATVSRRMVLIDGQAGTPAAGPTSVLPGVSGDGAGEQTYGLVVAGQGIAPYVVRDFRVEAGMAPVEVVVEAHPDDALFDAFQDDLAEAAPAPAGKAVAAPAAPTNLRFDAPTDSSCTVRWDAAEAATDYDINYRKVQGGRWTNWTHRGVRLYNTIHYLEPGTEYRWAVRAENSDGPSEWVFGPNFTTNEQPGPDLIVLLPSVSDNTLTPGQAFTLSATVQNQGDLPAAATTVRYYRSNNATITSSDTQVGTDAVGALTASATHADSIALTAPMEVLTYFYGACVDPVADESNTDNNCSTAVRVTVEASGTGETAEEVEAVTEETTKEADERHLVRLIYFLPNDRPYRAEVVRWMKEDIRNVQTFFAEQMQAHGYGNMTFRFETDAQGEPLVHRVDGQYPESHYYSTVDNQRVWQYRHFDELEHVFDFYRNTYVVYSDSDLSWGGAIAGGYTWKATGYVDYRREASWPDHITLAHELGHAFGLSHDFRDGAYLMSYGGPSQFPDAEGTDRISACAAKLLSVHPSFNSAIPIPIEDLSPATIEQRRRLYDPEYDSSLDENSPPFPIEDPSPPTIKLLSPTEYPVGSRSVSIKFQISDSDGLHQVLLYATPNIGTPWATGGLRECRAFEGERNAVVEFDYDGSLPFAAPLFLGGTKSSLSDPLHLIRVRVVDRDGNSRHMQFSLAKAGSAKASAKIAAAEPSALGVNVPYAEHSISCGVGLRREPIHVIDP